MTSNQSRNVTNFTSESEKKVVVVKNSMVTILQNFFLKDSKTFWHCFAKIKGIFINFNKIINKNILAKFKKRWKWYNEIWQNN